MTVYRTSQRQHAHAAGTSMPGGARGGFSLLELIVVLIVIALITGAVVPMFADSLRSMRRQRYVDDFLTAMKYAQERAITDSVEHRLYIDEKAKAFWVARLSVDVDALLGDKQDDAVETTVAARKRLAEFAPVDAAPGSRRYLPEGLEFDSLKMSQDKKQRLHFVAFYPNGSCDAATVKITRGRRNAIEIDTEGRLGSFKVTEKGRGE